MDMDNLIDNNQRISLETPATLIMDRYLSSTDNGPCYRLGHQLGDYSLQSARNKDALLQATNVFDLISPEDHFADIQPSESSVLSNQFDESTTISHTGSLVQQDKQYLCGDFGAW